MSITSTIRLTSTSPTGHRSQVISRFLWAAAAKIRVLDRCRSSFLGDARGQSEVEGENKYGTTYLPLRSILVGSSVDVFNSMPDKRISLSHRKPGHFSVRGFVLGPRVGKSAEESLLRTVSQFEIAFWVLWRQVPLAFKARCLGSWSLR